MLRKDKTLGFVTNNLHQKQLQTLRIDVSLGPIPKDVIWEAKAGSGQTGLKSHTGISEV